MPDPLAASRIALDNEQRSGLQPSSLSPVPTGAFSQPEPWVGAFIAGLSGWTLDAFDFFLVVLCLTNIGRDFGESMVKMAVASSATLFLRPVGALFFGFISDRFGRRRPLAVNLCFFAVVELCTAFTHSYTQFIILRALFGIVMGGQWGLGATLAMEKVPVRLRGILSGLFQQGYAIGFLLAAAAYFAIFPTYGWRPLFYLGSVPALAAAAYVAFGVTESRAFQENHSASAGDLARDLRRHLPLLVYFSIFMMTMHMSSHGTQDMYPTFLEKDHDIVGKAKAGITALGSVGAIIGGLSIGWISDRIGRRLAMRLALIGAIVVVPLWAYAPSIPLLIAGAMIMQFCVQGAWGVVPAHVAELSPASVRGTLPGLGNQIGVCLSGSISFIQAMIARGGKGYATAMAISAAVVFTLATAMTFVGREARSAELSSTH